VALPETGREPSPTPELLSVRSKLGYAAGDHTLNLALSSLTLFYLFFLTDVVGLSPGLAGLVLLVGRTVDAFSDPAMGRVSDRTRWSWGRRRPYIALGAIPFGVSFAALWLPYPGDTELERLLIFSSAYVVHTLASTVVSVPYVALLPELVLGYQARTSLNTYRAVAAVLGTLLAAGAMRPLASAFGGGADGFAAAAAVLGVWLALPWLAVYRATWERPEFRRPSRLGLLQGLVVLARHRTYLRLAAFYLCGRIAVDIVGAMFLFYFTYWLRREGDFELTLLLLLGSVALWLPGWLWISKRIDKHRAFILGAASWIAVQSAIFFLTPETPRWVLFALAALAGIGYAAADVMPWSMLGDVVDEDELLSGERREGLYSGFFTFLRKLGGAGGVALAGLAIDLAGFEAGAAEQPASALLAIRAVTGIAPACFLALGILFALGYPLTRAAHHDIRLRLEERGGRSDV
jgi:sugar (glycoside-pentoside-hexuronide) transporter